MSWIGFVSMALGMLAMAGALVYAGVQSRKRQQLWLAYEQRRREQLQRLMADLEADDDAGYVD